MTKPKPTEAKKKTNDQHLVDLHPDDRRQRAKWREWCIQEQARQGVDDNTLGARAGHTDGWVAGFRRTEMWRLSSMQEMTRALGYELRIEPHIANLPLIPTALVWPTVAAVSSKNPAHRDEAVIMDLGGVGKQLRELLVKSEFEVARILESEASVVRRFENGETLNFMYIRAQRYFRAIGAPLQMHIYTPDGFHVEMPEPTAQTWAEMDAAPGKHAAAKAKTGGSLKRPAPAQRVSRSLADAAEAALSNLIERPVSGALGADDVEPSLAARVVQFVAEATAQKPAELPVPAQGTVIRDEHNQQEYVSTDRVKVAVGGGYAFLWGAKKNDNDYDEEWTQKLCLPIAHFEEWLQANR